MLPFSKKNTNPRKQERKRKGPSLAERRAKKATAVRLCKQAYAILSKQPKLFSGHNIPYTLHEIRIFIERFNKGRLTYAQAQAGIGLATRVLDEIGIKYKP